MGGNNIINKLYEIPSRWVIASGKGVVIDGKPGENSPFAKSIIQALTTNSEEGLSISELSQYIRESTYSISNSQLPVSGILAASGHQGGEFIFFKQDVKEDIFWNNAVKKDNIEAFSNYLEIYPNGKYAKQGIERIKLFEEAKVWKVSLEQNSEDSYRDYLFKYPNGRYIKEANNLISAMTKNNKSASELIEIEEKRDKFCYKLCKTKENYQRYLELFPNGKFVEFAHYEIEKLSELIDLQLIRELKLEIAEANIKNVINILLSKESKFYDDFVLISTRWSSIMVKELKGINDNNDEIEKIKITNSIIGFLNQIEQEIKNDR